MEKHIIWKQEKGNIGKGQWLIRSVLVCLAYIVFGKGVMGLVGHLFGFQEVLRHGGVFFLAILGVALWNERPQDGQRKGHLPGNALLLGILAVVLWFAYKEAGEILKEGFSALGNVYMDRWKAHTSKYVLTDTGSVPAMLTAVEFLLLIVVPILEMLGCKSGKRRFSLMLPVVLICMGLLVVCSPQWEDIVFVFFSGVLFFYLDSYDKIDGKGLCVTVVGVLLLLGVTDGLQEKAEEFVISKNGEWFYLQENLEESIRNGSLFSRFSQEDRVDNSTPRYKDKEVIELSMSTKPTSNIYLRGYHCVDYREGVWSKDYTAFTDACAESEMDAEETAKKLFAIQHESDDVNGNEVITYELHYTGIRDENLYFPYAAGWEEGSKKYTFPADFMLNKKRSLKEAKVLSWKELRYLDERPLLGGVSDEQWEVHVVGAFHSGYSPDGLSDDEEALSVWYKEFVHQNYLQVPEDMPSVKQMAEKIQKSLLTNGGPNSWEEPWVNIEVRNSMCLQTAQLVSNQLRSENRYALELDKLPTGEDALEYFLSTSHKGYCVHFASAGTLILRELGVPARYVTGFVVKPDAVTYEEGTYKASVLDSDAHAWVEIYMENYGWIPVEMTPGYREGESEQQVVPVTPSVPETTPEPETEEPDEPEVTPETTMQPEEEKQEEDREESSDDIGDSGDGKGWKDSDTDSPSSEKRSTGRFVAGSILVLVVCLTGVALYQYHVGSRKRRARQLSTYMRRGENQKAVKWINHAIYKALVEIDRKYAKRKDEEYLEALKKEFGEIEEARWDGYFDVVRRTVYSREQLSAEEVKECYALYRLVQQNSKKNRKNS
ncbi:MAG: transglutaminase domain-containing protein [Lachnospiraceae bacterium]|nr:transglutaminase domain-containing protein [Lachnospiraceae bacterium]